MANNYFQFRQFTIQHDQCAMKVCTDACIFGAWVAEQISKRQLVAGTILDIGAGTGLLSMMLAQKTNGKIDAIEIDEPAFQQAKLNFEQSPWPNRLMIFHADAIQFYPGKKYDCIVSNPPFFEGDLESIHKTKNAAKHGTTLRLEQLLNITGNLLSPQGFLAVLLPFHRVYHFIEKAGEAGYCLNGQLLVSHTKSHPFFRGILLFSQNKTSVDSNEMAIKNEAGDYTPEFTWLLKDYYLYL